MAAPRNVDFLLLAQAIGRNGLNQLPDDAAGRDSMVRLVAAELVIIGTVLEKRYFTVTPAGHAAWLHWRQKPAAEPPVPRAALTARQRTLLLHIARLGRRGVAPSYAELARAMGGRSKGSLVRIVEVLQERGYVERLPRRARSMRLTPGALAMVQAMGLDADAAMVAGTA